MYDTLYNEGMFPPKFSPKDPFSLILSQDTRFAKTTPKIDNVWEIQLDGGELGGISLFSTISLRALALRITPIFSSQGENRINISQFRNEPVIESLCPDYVKLHTEIFPSITTEMEFWIPNSHLIFGVVNIINSSTSLFDGELQYIVNLKPIENGKIMTGFQSDRQFFLTGRTENISPVFYLSGNSHSGKFGQSSIETNYQIKPEEVHKIIWCFTFLDDVEMSINEIKKIDTLDFEKQIARVERKMQSERFLINSNNSDWDKAFIASQHAATQLVVSDPLDDHICLVECIHPEKTVYSQLSLSNQLSDGISPLQLWYFNQVIPNQTYLILDHLLKFFNSQSEDGLIPNHSNEKNFQYKIHAFPILAKVLFQIIDQLENRELVNMIFPKLILYLQKWLIKDPINLPPFWSNPLQSLYEDLPIHNFLVQNGDPIHTPWIQSPFLIALLLQEIEYCLKISDYFSIDFPEKEWLVERKSFLLNQLQTLWDTKTKIFRYKDIQTHRVSRKKNILSVTHSGLHQVEKSLQFPERISIKIISTKEFSRNTTIKISGFFEGQEINERFGPRQFVWSNIVGFATSSFVFDRISCVEVLHLPEGNSLQIHTSDFSQIDLTCCLPLMVEELPQKQKNQIIEEWIEKQFISKNGIPLVPKKYQKTGNDYQNKVDLPLCTLIMESLADNNQTELAKVIFEKTIEIIIISLRGNKRFFKLYDADDETCTGEYNIINGMIPLKLYLKLLGIHRWADDEIELIGRSVFLNDVTVQYQGTKIICSHDGYTIFTSSGKKFDLRKNEHYKIKIQK